MYIVEKVLKTRKRNGKLKYFVKWKGYPDKFNSWTTDVYTLVRGLLAVGRCPEIRLYF
jgi:hypothetical protein